MQSPGTIYELHGPPNYLKSDKQIQENAPIN